MRENKLLRYLKEQKMAAENTGDENEAVKIEWINATQRFVNEILKWLKEPISLGFIKPEPVDINISEKTLGKYTAHGLLLRFELQNEIVQVQPRGRYIVGAKGRIDLVIGNRRIKVIRGVEDNKWYLVKGYDKLKRDWDFAELSENTFSDLIIDLIQ